MELLRSKFPDRLISRALTALKNFFGLLKSKLYVDKPTTIAQMKHTIQTKIYELMQLYVWTFKFFFLHLFAYKAIIFLQSKILAVY